MIKYTNSFSENLKTLRKHQNLSQEQLADKLNLSRSIVGMWESGQRKPSFETLELLADFFNVRLDDLSGRNKQNSNSDSQLNLLIKIYKSLNDDNKKKLLELAQLYANSNNQ